MGHAFILTKAELGLACERSLTLAVLRARVTRELATDTRARAVGFKRDLNETTTIVFFRPLNRLVVSDALPQPDHAVFPRRELWL